MGDDDGNVWDHYEVALEYPNGVFCHIGQRQFPQAFSEVKDRVFCEKGTLEAPDRVITKDRSQKINWAFRDEAQNGLLGTNYGKRIRISPAIH